MDTADIIANIKFDGKSFERLAGHGRPSDERDYEAFPDLRKWPEVTWYGGKLEGGAYDQRQKGYYHCVVIVRGKPRADFFASRYMGSAEVAHNAAVDAWHAFCLQNRWIRNEWGICVVNGVDVYVTKLVQQQLLKCSLRWMPLVKKYCWFADKNGLVYYASARVGDKKATPVKFHRIMFPDAAVVDHINGDGCDNRDENVRAVSHAINNRNKRVARNSVSGVTGVSYRIQDGREYWVAKWTPLGERAISKRFRFEHYGGSEGAFQAAVAARRAGASEENGYVQRPLNEDS
jgi:hypothetical protein